MKFGAHILLKGGLEGLPQRAKRVECEVFQMFTRSPARAGTKALVKSEVAAFKESCSRLGYSRWYVHAPYVMNLAAADGPKADYSQNLIITELERGQTIGARAVVTHLGSATGRTHEQGLAQVVKALEKIRAAYKGPAELLLEISAGAGDLVGDRAEDFAAIHKATGLNWGICLDTAHLFGSGYDLRTTTSVGQTLAMWDSIVGLANVKLWHFNDSAVPLASKKDRHAHIGKGEIGLEGFRAIIGDRRFQDVDAIIETPKDNEINDDIRNLRLLKSLRAQSES